MIKNDSGALVDDEDIGIWIVGTRLAHRDKKKVPFAGK